jgi:hypothetical protein
MKYSRTLNEIMNLHPESDQYLPASTEVLMATSLAHAIDLTIGDKLEKTPLEFGPATFPEKALGEQVGGLGRFASLVQEDPRSPQRKNELSRRYVKG